MNELIQKMKWILADGMALSEIGYRRNGTPLSTQTGVAGSKYPIPREVFKLLADDLGKAGDQLSFGFQVSFPNIELPQTLRQSEGFIFVSNFGDFRSVTKNSLKFVEKVRVKLE